jgi:PadR family transcriptional regulator PadR
VESASGPSRKYYTLTAEGRRQLALMQQEWQEFVTT